ncbi:MAG: pyrroline-5-carboxylate reductase [Eubacteriales bacterium]|nr:pyrroline-5-carboxylate reductase [Eubacteriales bacterium]
MENKAIPVVAFVGAGNIASAFIRGFITTGILPEGNIIIFDKYTGQYDNYKDINVIKAKSCNDIAAADYVFICVKPYQVSEALNGLKDSGIELKGKTFISVCAGVPISYINSCLGFEAPVIRTMPSTPMLVGMGAVAISKNDITDKKSFEYICRIISEIAVITVLEESQMNGIISVNGSSPAYVYLFIKAMLDGAEENGIAKENALPLILKTVEGSVQMVRRSGKSIERLIEEVSSPNGTTLKALEKLYEGNFEADIKAAMNACTVRANEITQELTKA